MISSVLSFSQTEVFEGSFEQLKITARKKHKAYIVDFSTSWCGYCKKFDREVMPDSSFSSLVNQQFLFGRVDGDVEKDLVVKYKVSGYPTFIIFNNRGEEIKRFNGYVDAKSFVSTLNYLGYKGEVELEVSLDEYETEKLKQIPFNLSDTINTVLIQKAIEVGKADDLLSKEDLIIDYPIQENLIQFYYEVAQNGFDVQKLNEAVMAKVLSASEAHKLLLEGLLEGKSKVEITYLSLVNTLLLEDSDNYYLLDTKAYIYFKLGRNKEGIATAKMAKKIASKKKLNYSATELLLDVK